jgi:carbon monoxide dehydrogenase subunit G
MVRLRIAMNRNDFGETVLSTQTSATFYTTGLMSSLFAKNVTVTAIREGKDTRLIVLADVMLGSPAGLLDRVAKIASEEVVLEEA